MSRCFDGRRWVRQVGTSISEPTSNTSYAPIGPDKQLWREAGELVAMEIQLLQDACPINRLGEADEPVVGGP